jgi:hypothetical protein
MGFDDRQSSIGWTSLHSSQRPYIHIRSSIMTTFEKCLKYGIDDSISFFYLDWVNNFLTLAVFAEHYGETEKVATDLINRGREIRG